ncbi:Hypothetical protein PBC10988_19170 [Planctomycetales bacterium 10988]|nr:Hypothetical protein PBC10988_19170 [Planctomycetales bacterium 10988]
MNTLRVAMLAVIATACWSVETVVTAEEPTFETRQLPADWTPEASSIDRLVDHALNDIDSQVAGRFTFSIGYSPYYSTYYTYRTGLFPRLRYARYYRPSSYYYASYYPSYYTSYYAPVSYYSYRPSYSYSSFYPRSYSYYPASYSYGYDYNYGVYPSSYYYSSYAPVYTVPTYHHHHRGGCYYW